MNKTDKTVGKVEMAFKMMRMLMMMLKVETAFKMFDKNRDGFITKDEFAQVGTHGHFWNLTFPSSIAKQLVSKKEHI